MYGLENFHYRLYGLLFVDSPYGHEDHYQAPDWWRWQAVPCAKETEHWYKVHKTKKQAILLVLVLGAYMFFLQDLNI